MRAERITETCTDMYANHLCLAAATSPRPSTCLGNGGSTPQLYVHLHPTPLGPTLMYISAAAS